MSRKKFKLNLQPKRDKSAEDKRLGLLAQELGFAGMVVLINDYGFTRAQANEWLDKMLEQAKTTRMLLGAQTAIETIKVLEDDGRLKPKS